MAMSNWPKLAVFFASDSIIDLDLQAIHDDLCKCYKIGYTELFDRGTHLSVYIQTVSKGVKITPAKVLRICEGFGALEELPKTYKQREGVLVSEIGCFKKPGRQKDSKKRKCQAVEIEQTRSALETEPTRSEETESSHSDQQESSHSDQEPCDERKEEPDADPLFIPVYSGFNRDWKIESWNRSTTDFKRASSSKFRAHVLERQDHKCNYCGCDVSFGDYSNADMDHVIPLKAGGTNTLHNVQVLCTPDHRKKTALESRRVSIALSVMMDAAFVPNEDYQ